MKKIIFSLGLCLCVGFTAVAQNMVVISEEVENPAFLSKRGVPLLPQAGDFAIGVEATPFLKYAGNFFNQAGNNAAPAFSGKDVSIYGKYFLENDRAIRARLTINAGSSTEKGVVPNNEERANNPLNANATVVDAKINNATNVMLSAGYEFRRGHGRVQGFYGGEASLGFGSKKDKYEYANPMTAVNPTPSTWNFNTSAVANVATRTTETKYGNTVTGGVGAFVGVEYFFAPQMSIGGEFSLGLYYTATSQTEGTTETWNASANSLQTQSSRNGNWDAMATGLKTIPEGRLFLLFHF